MHCFSYCSEFCFLWKCLVNLERYKDLHYVITSGHNRSFSDYLYNPLSVHGKHINMLKCFAKLNVFCKTALAVLILFVTTYLFESGLITPIKRQCLFCHQQQTLCWDYFAD